MRKFWPLSVLLLTALIANVVTGNQTTKALSLLNLPIGEQRNAVFELAEQQWGTQATCTTIRTGVGVTRRAYFLETCVYTNEQGNTLYDETPVTATYRFLESQLVQISYEFEEIQDAAKFKRCAHSDAKKIGNAHSETSDTVRQSLTLADNFQLSVSDADMVGKIHALR